MWRRGVAAVVAGVVVCAGVVPRAAADEMTQWYYEVMKIKAVHDQGYDGKGVKIALIDGKADLTMPELKGADATVKTFCNAGSVPEHEVHASNVLATMAAPVWGWAPKATYTVYAAPVGQGQKTSNLPPECQKMGSGFLLSQALNDKNDVVVITTSESSLMDVRLNFQLVRAAERGVPVVVAAGNDGLDRVDPIGRKNLTIVAGAVGRDGRRWAKSNYGPGLTLMAPGEDVAIRERSAPGVWGGIRKASGTSFAAPQVGAILALGKQAYPQLHGNQLIRSLIATANNPSGSWNPAFGNGLVNATNFVNANPVGEYNTSPLMDKIPDSGPDQKDVTSYKEGIVDYIWMDTDNEFKYRGPAGVGCDSYPPERRACGTSKASDSIAPSPQSSTSSSRSENRQSRDAVGVNWWVGGALIALVLGGAAASATFFARRPR